MQAALRPMNPGEILDRTFAIYRKNFLLFGGIAVLPAAVMLGLRLFDIAWVRTDRLAGVMDPESQITWGWFVGYWYYHFSGFLWALMRPAFVGAVSRNVFNENNSILGSVRFIGARWRTYSWLAFLKMLAQLIAPEALAFGLFLGCAFLSVRLGYFEGGDAIAALMLSLSALVLVGFFWIGACLGLAIPAAALEEMRAWKAIRRSWLLTRGTRWRIFVAWLMAIICASVLDVLAALLAWWIAALLYTGHMKDGFDQQVYNFVDYCLYAVIGTIVGPLYPVAVTLFYYDQRARKEGYDVELMMDAAGLAAPAPVASPAPAGAETADVLVPGGSDALEFSGPHFISVPRLREDR